MADDEITIYGIFLFDASKQTENCCLTCKWNAGFKVPTFDYTLK